MRKAAFFLGAFLFILTVALNINLITSGSVVLGIFSLLGTILVFSTGIIWLIRQDDQALHLKNLWLIFPLGVFGAGLFLALNKMGMAYSATEESIPEIGNIIMSRYQVGLWLVSGVLLLSFAIAGSLMIRGKS